MKTDNGEALEHWLRPLPFGVFLALALFACFPQVFTGAESFYFRDYGVLGYPNIHFQRECFWRGELPLWNPYSNCGQPFLAQWGTMALYPFALIYLLLPIPWSLGLFCFAHLWLGGFAMYFLARRWTQVNFAGAVAGTAYIFNGILFASFIWPNYLVALGWMPLIVLLAERAWREGGRWIVGTAIVAALQMLSGAPEIILFTWLITGILWVLDALRVPVAAFPLFRRIAFVVLLTAGLAAAQLLPFFELLQESHRDVSFATAKWQFPIWGWANFLVPFYNAIESPGGQYFQYEQAFLSSVYLGAPLLALALVGLFRWPDARLWLLFIIAAAALLFSFGDRTPPFTALREAVPLLGFARYPVKFLFLLAFIVPLLAGCGIAAVFRSRLRGALIAAGLLMLVALLVIAWAARTERFVDYNAWPPNFHDNFNYTWNKALPGRWLADATTNVLQRLAFNIAALAFLGAALRFGPRAPVWAFIALALIAADTRTHTPMQNPSLPAAELRSRAWPAELLPPAPGSGRVLITPEMEEFLTYLGSTNAARVWRLKRATEWSSLNVLDEIPKVNGSSTLQTRRQRLLEQTLYSMTNRLPASLLDFLGVAYVAHTNQLGQWSRRETSLPLLTAGQEAVFRDNTQALSILTNAAFDAKRFVLLPPETRAWVIQTNAVAAAVSATNVTPHSLEAEVNAPQPTLLVIAQSWYPCWKASINGVPAPLLPANLAFQAVPVPAGQHRVRVTYQDSRLRLGAMVSGGALLLCALVWWRSGRQSAR